MRNQIIRDSNFEYQYDLNGNLVAKYEKSRCGVARTLSAIDPCSEISIDTLYNYDEDNRLASVNIFPRNEYELENDYYLRYDPLDRRIFKREKMWDGSVGIFVLHDKWYAYDGDDVLATYRVPARGMNDTVGATVLDDLYTHGPGVDEPLVWWHRFDDASNGGDLYKPFLFTSDGLGSITGITGYNPSQSGNQGLLGTYTYDSYGNTLETCSKDTGDNISYTYFNPYRYAAKEWDEFKLYNNYHRNYDPTLGSFYQEDPKWDANLYIYSTNNPIYYKDITGESECSLNGEALVGYSLYGGMDPGKYGTDYIGGGINFGFGGGFGIDPKGTSPGFNTNAGDYKLVDLNVVLDVAVKVGPMGYGFGGTAGINGYRSKPNGLELFYKPRPLGISSKFSLSGFKRLAETGCFGSS